jgi:tetratricopeptide (TPR) repeat protein
MRGADLLRDRGKHAEAVRVYDQWLRDHPFDPIAWNHKGMCLRALGDPAGAMQCFEQALLHDSGCWSALNNKGALLRDEALLPEAVEAFSVAVALTLDPAPRENLAATLTDLGTRLKRVGKSLEAISKYEEALEVKADFAPAWFNLGFALAEENRMEEAVKSYLKALEARPDYLEALCNLGVIYKDSGRLDEAIACYERARACSPNCEIVNANLVSLQRG